MNISPIEQSLYEHPEDWKFSEYLAVHTPSKMALWIANGRPYLGVYAPFKLKLSIWHRIRLWRAIRQAKRRQIAHFLRTTDQAASAEDA